MIWLVPGVVVALLALPVVLAVRRCALEASALRRSLSSLVELRGPLAALQSEAAALASDVPVALRRRSVVQVESPALGPDARPGLPAAS